MSGGKPVGVAGERALHPSRETGLGRTQEDVDVVGHAGDARDLKTEPVQGLGQSLPEPLVVAFVVKDPLASVSP